MTTKITSKTQASFPTELPKIPLTSQQKEERGLVVSHVNKIWQWFTSWVPKETLFQKAVKSGSLTITTANGSILLEYREDFGCYSLGMVDEYGKITLIHAKNQISLQREALPYLEKIERQNGLIAQATRRDVSRIRCDLEDAGLIEEERGVITFKDGGALIKFTGDDRDEKLALYLRWVMPEEAKPSTFERTMMGVVGLTMLGSVIAPAFEAISRLQAQFFPNSETISRLRSHLSPHSLECTAGLVVSGLCVASGQNKELCVALPLLSCLGKVFAEIVVVNPIPDQVAYPGQDFTLALKMYSTFHESDPSLPMKFSMTQTDGSPLPTWLSFKESNNPTLVGSLALPDSGAVTVHVMGNTAYLTDQETGLKIISVADPAHPSLLKTLVTSAGILAEQIIGDKAYVVDSLKGLLVISITNPYQPSILGSLTLKTTNKPPQIRIIGNTAYVTTGDTDLKIISIEDPLHPSLLGSFTTPDDANGLYVVGTIAYIADSASLQIVSVANAKQPTLLGSLKTNGAQDIYVFDNKAYIADYRDFLIISVTDPAHPSLLGSMSTFYSEVVYATKDIAYVVEAGGLLIISVTDPVHPSLVGSFETNVNGIYVVDNKAYIAARFFLGVLSVADPAHPSLLGSIATVDAVSVYIVDDKAYVGDEGSGFKIISIADSSHPSLLSSLCTSDAVRDSYALNDKVYILDGFFLKIISVADPTNPSILGTFPSYGFCISVVGDKAYVGDSGLTIISVADPTHPASLGSFTFISPQFTLSIYVSSDKAYLISETNELQIISVSDPTKPSSLGYYGCSSLGPRSLYVIEDKVYAAGGNGVSPVTFLIISVADPYHPILLGSLHGSAGYNLYVFDDKAYIITYNGLQVISVTDPCNPSIIGSLAITNAWGIYITEEMAYVTDENGGLEIIDIVPCQLSGATPITEHGKIYNISLTAQNSLGEKASTNFLLEVYDEGPHVVSPISDQTVHIGKSFDFIVPAGTFIDPYGDILQYTSTLVDGGNLPNWLTFNTTSHRFKGTPIAESDIKDWQLQVKVEDPYKKSAATDFTLDVLHLGPVVAHGLSDQTIHIANPFDFTTPSDTFDDLDGLSLFYSSTLVDGANLPTWLAFNTTSHRFRGTPLAESDIKAWQLQVKAKDPYKKSATTDFTLDVLHLGPVVVHGLSDQVVHVGHLFDFTTPSDTFNDLDGLSLFYSSTLVDGANLPTWLAFNTTSHRFRGTPVEVDDVKAWQLQVKVEDFYKKSAATNFTLDVLHLGPVVAHGLSDHVVHVGHPFDFTVPSDTFDDLDELSLFYSSTLVGGTNLPNWLAFNTTSHRFRGTPLVDADMKIWPIEVKVDDFYKKSAATNFTLSALHFGPSVAHLLANQTLEVGRLLAFTVPEDTFLNPDGVSLAYSSKLSDNQPLPTWLYFNTVARKFSGTPQDITDVQDWDVTVRVDDHYGKHAKTNFYLDVYKNGIKIHGSIPQRQIFANVPFEYTFPEDLFIDQDRLPLKFRASLSDDNPLPLWLNFDPDTRTFSGTAPDSVLGLYQIRLYADDHYSNAHVDFKIVVYPFHYQPPTPNKGIPNEKAYIGKYFTFTVPDTAFTNPNKDKFTYNAFLSGGKPLPGWLSFDKKTKTFSGSPKSEEKLSIAVTVTDSYHASAESTFSLTTINEVTQTIKIVFAIGGPVISALGAMITVYANKANLRNWWKKKKYQLPDETIQVGSQFTHKITKSPARNIGEIRVFKREKSSWKESSTGEYLSSWWNDHWEALPAKQLLPPWLEYHSNNNELSTLPQKMTESDIGDYKVRICNKDKYRVEEFILHLQGAIHALEEAPPRAAAKSSGANASAELRDPVQGDMSEPLLRDEENGN